MKTTIQTHPNNYHLQHLHIANTIASTLGQTQTWAHKQAYSMMAETYGWTPAETLRNVEEAYEQLLAEVRA
jgi:hypothetical protein